MGIMQENVSRVADRGDRLEDLQDKSGVCVCVHCVCVCVCVCVCMGVCVCVCKRERERVND